MTLDDLLATREWNLPRLAAAVSAQLPPGSVPCNPSSLSRLRGSVRASRRTASLQLAIAIERATGGDIRAEDLPISARTRTMLRELRRLSVRAEAAEARA